MESLPNEILVQIFTSLNIQDLARCAQVSKKWRIISKDKKLWLKANLCLNSISGQTIEAICSHETKYLGLRSATIRGPSCFPEKNNLKYLDLSRCQNSGENDRDILVELTASCNLEKLSVASLFMSSSFIKSIQQNAPTLKVLDLTECRGLTPKSIKRIVTKCTGLTELNVQRTHLDRDSISSLCRYLPKSLEKLNLSFLPVKDEQVQKLVTRCNNLSELDLSGTQITYDAVPYIIENISHSLVKLSLPNQVDDLQELIELASMPKLQYLWYNFNMVRRPEKCKKRLAHLKINEGNLTIASPNSCEIFNLQGFWNINCHRLNLFPRI